MKQTEIRIQLEFTSWWNYLKAHRQTLWHGTNEYEMNMRCKLTRTRLTISILAILSSLFRISACLRRSISSVLCTMACASISRTCFLWFALAFRSLYLLSVITSPFFEIWKATSDMFYKVYHEIQFPKVFSTYFLILVPYESPHSHPLLVPFLLLLCGNHGGLLWIVHTFPRKIQIMNYQ